MTVRMTGRTAAKLNALADSGRFPFKKAMIANIVSWFAKQDETAQLLIMNQKPLSEIARMIAAQLTMPADSASNPSGQTAGPR